jgi:hypothetical protein
MRKNSYICWQIVIASALACGSASALADDAVSQDARWAFQPVQAIAVPAVRNEAWCQSPVDRFVLARLETAGLAPNPPAQRLELIRRVSFDLTGLPPTPEEIDAFLADHSPDAFAKVVDRLLASRHYGERWGRHWLDVVRYAETTANDANAVMRFAWRFRDYVIQSLNADKPYDQFLTEQLAGDLLTSTADLPTAIERIVATGFLMIGPKALAETDKEQSRLDVIDDQLDVVGRAFLGLTISCARCHDHKFDPLTASDYYALAGIFRSTEVFRDEVRNASMWQEWPLPIARHRPLVVMAPKEGKVVDLNIHLRGDRHTLGPVAPRRFPQAIAGSNQPTLPATQSGRLELARWLASPTNPLTARVAVNRIWQHHFGTGLVATSDNFGARGDRPSHPDLLDWLAGEFVRSGWSIKHIHRLIMRSATYQMSSNPDLGTNPQSAIPNPKLLDPSNRLLWRMPLRRLDAEELRDAMLAVGGRLDMAPGGSESGEFLYGRGEVIDKNRDFFRPNRVRPDDSFYSDSRRRSIYLPVVRNAVPDVLALFDGADPNAVTTRRNDTTDPSQALFLLNHPLVRNTALHFAERLIRSPASSDGERVRLAYRLALGRTPAAAEQAAVLQFLANYQARSETTEHGTHRARLAAWQSFCQTLLCRNEFLYVE